MIRTSLLLGLLAPLAGAPETLRVAPEAGTELTKAFSSSLALELVEFSLEVNGEEQEEAPAPEVTLFDQQEIVLVDRYVKVGDDGPLELVRTFESLKDSSTQAVIGPDGSEDESSTEGASELEGVAVRFRWDEDEGEWAKTLEDDDRKVDPDLLTGLEVDADFGFLLPEGDVEEGDSWDLDVVVFDLISSPSGDLAIHGDDHDADADREFQEQFRGNLGGDLEATLVSLEGGRATIEIEGDVETTVTRSPEPPEGAPGDLEVTQELQFNFECEGTLIWDLDRGVAVSLEFGGAVALEMVGTQSQGEDFEVVITQLFEGEWLNSAEFE